MVLVREVEYVTALTLKDLKAEINKFFVDHTSPRWHLVTIEDGANKSYTAWFEYENTD